MRRKNKKLKKGKEKVMERKKRHEVNKQQRGNKWKEKEIKETGEKKRE